MKNILVLWHFEGLISDRKKMDSFEIQCWRRSLWIPSLMEWERDIPESTGPLLYLGYCLTHKRIIQLRDNRYNGNETASLFMKHIGSQTASRHPASLNAPCREEIKLSVS